ncbi:hypothetical protein KNE206_52850 [Kitasatospora sp. NE20-6]|uniref:hypothetical protein n=1 Tax=Kitasatospora sp. NE20-6 TaxID=2859066 RepID=UPI0034DBD221
MTARDLVIAGCSRRKNRSKRLLPALDRYTGGIAPQLRERVAGHPDTRRRVRFLSAAYGLVTADTPLPFYERPLTPHQASIVRPKVAEQLAEEFRTGGVPDRILLVLEPAYVTLLADLTARADCPALHWVGDPRGWPQAAAVLDDWRWP